MPSTSHPTTLRSEEELQNMKVCLAPSSKTTQMMCNGLSGVGDLYELIGELLRLPSNQKYLNPCQKKWVEEQLDESLKMLDLIAAVRDSLVAMREHVQDLRSAIRRKGNAATVPAKKAQKLIKGCLRTLKLKNGKALPCSVTIKDSDMLVKVSVEARQSTLSLLQSIVSFLSKPKQQGRRWSLVSKAVSKRRIACEGELENAEMWLQASYDCIACRDVDPVRVLKAQSHLEPLEIRVENLVSGLECLFKRLIQNRVSLLNLLGS